MCTPYERARQGGGPLRGVVYSECSLPRPSRTGSSESSRAGRQARPFVHLSRLVLRTRTATVVLTLPLAATFHQRSPVRRGRTAPARRRKAGRKASRKRR